MIISNNDIEKKKKTDAFIYLWCYLDTNTKYQQ